MFISKLFYRLKCKLNLHSWEYGSMEKIIKANILDRTVYHKIIISGKINYRQCKFCNKKQIEQVYKHNGQLISKPPFRDYSE